MHCVCENSLSMYKAGLEPSVNNPDRKIIRTLNTYPRPGSTSPTAKGIASTVDRMAFSLPPIYASFFYASFFFRADFSSRRATEASNMGMVGTLHYAVVHFLSYRETNRTTSRLTVSITCDIPELQRQQVDILSCHSHYRLCLAAYSCLACLFSPAQDQGAAKNKTAYCMPRGKGKKEKGEKGQRGRLLVSLSVCHGSTFTSLSLAESNSFCLAR